MGAARLGLHAWGRRAAALTGGFAVVACAASCEWMFPLVETEATDAGSPHVDDAGDVDSGGGGGDAALAGCRGRSSSLLFCADFDEPPFLTGWLPLSATAPGDAGVDDALASSAPNSLWVSTAAAVTGGPGSGSAGLYQRMPDAYSKWQFGFALYIDAYDEINGSHALPAGVDFSGPPYYYLQIYIGASESFVHEKVDLGDGSRNTTVSHAFDPRRVPPRKWTRLDVTVEIKDATTSTVMLLIDGQPGFIGPATQPSLAHGFVNPRPGFGVGVDSIAAPASGWILRFDDVTFDGIP